MNAPDHFPDPPLALVRSVPRSAWSLELRAITIGLILTVTLVAFEALAIATVMPRVARDLNGLALYGWVFSAFFLGDLVGIVTAGLLVDRRGLLAPYLVGLGLFAAGLIVGGLSPAMPILILGRSIQGFGAGAIPAVAYVAIGREYPAAVRPRMFAYLSTAWVVPGLVGPALAGIVGDVIGWRAVFLGLVPMVGVAAVLTIPPLARVDGRSSKGLQSAPPVKSPASASAPPPGSESPASAMLPAGAAERLWGAVRVAAGSTLLLAALGGRDPVVGLVLGAAGIAVGLPALRRLVPPGTLLAKPGLPRTVLLRGVLTFGFTGAEAYLPLALVSVRGMSTSAAGLALTAATISWTSGAWLQAHRVVAWGAPRFIRAGFILVAVGIVASASVLHPSVPVGVAVVAWGIAGLGMGLSYAPITLTVLALAPGGEQGAATAGLQLSDVLGTAFGAGTGGAVVALGSAAQWDPRLGLLLAFMLAAAAAVAGYALARGPLVPRRT